MTKEDLENNMDEFIEFCKYHNIILDAYATFFDGNENYYAFTVTKKLFDELMSYYKLKEETFRIIGSGLKSFKLGKWGGDGFTYYGIMFNEIKILPLLADKCYYVKLQGVNEHLK